MRPPKSPLAGGVDIIRCVGVFMVMTMVCGPPERSLLGAGGAPKSENELEKAACFVSPVGKIPVVGARDGEHAEVIHE